MEYAEGFSDDLIHFTTFSSMIDILKTGCIKGARYPFNKDHISTFPILIDFEKTYEKSDVLELCLIRKSRSKNIADITDSIKDELDTGIVKVLFNFDRICSEIRYIKKPYPIAELILLRMSQINNKLWKMTHKRDICKELVKYIYNTKNTKLKDFDYVLNMMQKFCDCIDTSTYSSLDSSKSKDEEELRTFISFYVRNLIKRECEERLDLTKNTIPLDPRYLRFLFECDRSELPKQIKSRISLYSNKLFMFNMNLNIINEKVKKEK